MLEVLHRLMFFFAFFINEFQISITNTKFYVNKIIFIIEGFFNFISRNNI